MKARILFLLVTLLAPSTAGAAEAPPFTVKVVGAGPPVILLPGLASPGEVWDDLVARLAPTHECHVLTLAGFAGAAPRADFSLHMERDAVLAYMRERRLVRPVLIGHSLGGFLALWIASAAPGEVGGVVSMDGLPSLGALSPGGDPARLRDLLAGMTPEAFAAQNRAALGGMISRPEDVTRVAAASGRSDPRTIGQAVYEMLTTDLRQEVARITVPVLLIGAGGGMSPAQRDESRKAYEAQIAPIPRHRFALVATARHFVMLDEPRTTARLVAGFLGARR